jgi:hypothetical protein
MDIFNYLPMYQESSTSDNLLYYSFLKIQTYSRILETQINFNLKKLAYLSRFEEVTPMNVANYKSGLQSYSYYFLPDLPHACWKQKSQQKSPILQRLPSSFPSFCLLLTKKRDLLASLIGSCTSAIIRFKSIKR